MKRLGNLLFIILLLTATYTFGQDLTADGATHTIEKNGNNNWDGSEQDFTIPADALTLGYDHIEFTLKGGDGGSRRVPNLCRTKGGEGATVVARIRLGLGENQLQPGGTVRFIVGKKGDAHTGNGLDGAAGGGGSAILYHNPGSTAGGVTRKIGGSNYTVPSLDLDDADDAWVILAVAGGGGGAYTSGVCGGSAGRGGKSSTCGGNGICTITCYYGGCSGNAGEGDGAGGGGIIQYSGTGYGGAGGFNGGKGGRGNGVAGGYGYGGGGRGKGVGGGGGGGYSGGSQGYSGGGGGGGSFVIQPVAHKSFSNGGTIYNSEHGFITYTFQDRETETPDMYCQNVQLSLDASGSASVSASSIDNGSSDAIGSTLSLCLESGSSCLSSLSFDCNDLGTHVVTLQGTNSEESATCVADVTVIDEIAPNAVCRNIVVNSNAAGQVIVDPAAVDGGTTDNCTSSGNFSYSLDRNNFTYVHFGNRTEVVTLTVSDESDNESTCTAQITMQDNLPPVISCRDRTYNYGNSFINTINLNSFITNVYDEGGAGMQATTPAYRTVRCSDLGNQVVTLTRSDNAGNTSSCTANLTVNDVAAPQVNCPADITTPQDAGECGAVVSYNVTHTDNCGASRTQTDASGLTSGDEFPLGVTTQTYSATDASGNTASCSFTVTVNDVEPPTLSCPTSVVQNNEPNQCSAVVNYTVSSADNCSASHIQADNTGLSSGDVFPSGSTTLSYQATDASGNTASCSFDVIVTYPASPLSISQNITEACTSSPLGLIVDACGASSYRVNSRSHSLNCYVYSSITSFPQTIQSDGLADDVVYISGTSAEMITYNITPISSLGVEGASQDIHITINPAPMSVSGLFAMACGGIQVNADLAMGQTPPAGIDYEWEPVMPLPAGVNIVSGFNEGTTHIIDDVIHNTGAAPAIIPYHFRLRQGNCASSNYLIYFYVLPNGSCNMRLAERTEILPYLPIELTASKHNAHDVQLSWNQHTEPMPISYRIEKKRNDGEFEPIAEIDAVEGTETYAFLDQSGMSNANQYRVRLIFENGLAAFSNEAEVNFEYFDNKFTIFPNPNNGRFNLKAPRKLAGEWKYTLSDAMGREIRRGVLSGQDTPCDIREVAGGYYYLVITNPTGKQYVQKIVKN